ncbi:type VI secretion system-associated protein TagF [Rhodovulum euryhalinum]|uniref:Type VI secretion system protein ImpM n=1 Tax=Rhodovulum euryhalinum TaxID=35805 RepID=A0A4R2KAP7_9RHOB|nr:type VI secretion system-associated protein TagF [Rhodovulum euryhalinum]TCO70523.1 type VI secretion system protein ImpM [Rhodovulum euryhalinum]
MPDPGSALFGKVPALGDFVARGLPSGLRAPLDRWLTAHLAQRAQAPETWPDGGLRATLILNGTSLSALILPSADRTGRAFPLACCHLPGLGRAAADAWCDAALPAACGAANGTLAADALIAALAALPAPAPGPAEPGLWARDRPSPADEPTETALARLFGPVSSG